MVVRERGQLGKSSGDVPSIFHIKILRKIAKMLTLWNIVDTGISAVVSLTTIGVDLIVVPATPVLFHPLRVHSVSWKAQAISIFISKALLIELRVYGRLTF